MHISQKSTVVVGVFARLLLLLLLLVIGLSTAAPSPPSALTVPDHEDIFYEYSVDAAADTGVGNDDNAMDLWYREPTVASSTNLSRHVNADQVLIVSEVTDVATRETVQTPSGSSSRARFRHPFDDTAMINCKSSMFKCVLLSVIFGLLIICTVIGNAFVIAAVILERNLHGVANYLIVSLAFADLTVSIMVMPFSAYKEVTNGWSLGKILCDIWTSFDVLSCTASIFHLVAIALDRYWAITNVEYGVKRTRERIFAIIVVIWTVSAVVAITPHLFGLSYDETKHAACHLTDNFTYQLISTFTCFYLPLIFMCVIYWKIFQAAKFRIRKKGFDLMSAQAKQAKKAKKAAKGRKSVTAVIAATVDRITAVAEGVSSFQIEIWQDLIIKGSVGNRFANNRLNRTTMAINFLHKID